jgi:hypothetical protein
MSDTKISAHVSFTVTLNATTKKEGRSWERWAMSCQRSSVVSGTFHGGIIKGLLCMQIEKL